MNKSALAAIVAAAMLAAGCKEAKKAPLPVVVEAEPEADNAAYGVCGEGTAMHTMELIRPGGDTVTYFINDDDSVVFGGLRAGDSMTVVAGSPTDVGLAAAKIVNLTSLLGRWTSLERSFEISRDGTVRGSVAEPAPYTTWKMSNGRLVMAADTFDILFLGPDSLCLGSGKAALSYRRATAGTR